MSTGVRELTHSNPPAKALPSAAIGGKVSAMDLNGVAIRAIRERSGLSVTALAEMSGIKQSHLSNIEAGRRRASAEVGVALARALKVDLHAILAGPGEKAGV